MRDFLVYLKHYYCSLLPIIIIFRALNQNLTNTLNLALTITLNLALILAQILTLTQALTLILIQTLLFCLYFMYLLNLADFQNFG